MSATTTPKADLAAIRQALSILFAPGDVVELRAPKTPKRTQLGFYNDHAKLAKDVVNLNGQISVYVTLNEVDTSLLARSANHLTPYAESGLGTSDDNITRRRFFPIDIDPRRDALISSTDSEHEAALLKVQECANFLISIGFPQDSMITADSGNGGHILSRIDLPNDSDSTKLIKNCLKALDAIFTDGHVKVDTSIFNAGRIWKVYGSMARKGDNLPDRPHRLARILTAPDTLAAAPKEALERLAAMKPDEPEVESSSYIGTKNGKQSLDVAKWLSEHGIKVKLTAPWGDKATKYILEPCPFDSAHTGTSVAVFQFANGAISFRCLHNGCNDRTWADLRKLKEPSYKDRRNSHREGDADKKRPSVATRLVEMAGDVDLVHTPDGIPYAVIQRGGHIETWPLASRAVRDDLARRYYEETGGAPHSQALQDALNVLRGRALFAGREEPVHTRLAARDGKLYLDLCDPGWRVVEITANGWQVISDSPVRFARSRGMAALPLPQSGGSVGALRDFLNVASGDWPLLLAWLVGAFMPAGPYPVLVLTGEQGSAKSTAGRVLRSLIDPSTVPLRSLPREERDLAITAGNSWVIALDNVSNLPHWLSDAISRLATGGGFATRELYTDAEERLFAATRPVVLNGIGDIATRSDLLDRAIIVTLPTIPDDKRRTEAELWGEFEEERPRILAALLTALALALRGVNAVRLAAAPRMVDFANWVVAASPALGMEPGDFLDAYTGNRRSIHELALESSQVAAAVIALTSELSDGGEWTGTATELLERLNTRVGDTMQRQKGWPKNGRSLSSTLMRFAPNLRAVGINVERGEEGSGKWKRRFLRIRKGMQISDPCDPCDPLATAGSQKWDAKSAVGGSNSATAGRKGRKKTYLF